MIDNPELQELYRTISDVLDGYNRTHGVQVSYVDFAARVPGRDYSGSVVCREYDQSIIDYHYRDLRDDDYDWYAPEDWLHMDRARDVDRIGAANRRAVQAAHRAGRDLSMLWYVNRAGRDDWRRHAAR